MNNPHQKNLVGFEGSMIRLSLQSKDTIKCHHRKYLHIKSKATIYQVYTKSMVVREYFQ
jgi:hypothetical protein